MPVLFSDKNDVAKYVAMDSRALCLADRFWPGALTMILPLLEGINLPRKIIGERGSLAVRIPRHECCLRLIRACGGALIGTSANVSGQASFLDADDQALSRFASNATYFVKGKCGKRRIPSTIIDLTSGEARFDREGAVAKKDILSYLEKASKTDSSSR